MNDENKKVFGKVLGEIYRIQNRLEISNGISSAKIYGLLNGFERTIDEEIENIGWTSDHTQDQVETILDKYFSDEKLLKKFKGYYDIDSELKHENIDRMTAIRVIKMLKEEGRFITLINKMDSSDSPVECRTFNLYNWET